MASLFIDCLSQHCGCGPAHVQPYWILVAPILIACSIWGQNFQVHVALGSWLWRQQTQPPLVYCEVAMCGSAENCSADF